MRLRLPSWPLLYGLIALMVISCRAQVGPLSPFHAAPRPIRERPAPPKPRPAPPVSLTADDGTGLALVAVRARAVVEDPLAMTELEFQFDNPQRRTLEGRFELLLPQGAQVTRFATYAVDHWKEAEVVEKQYARQTYEAFVHAQRDPALLERDTGNRFRGRVFPIEPYGRTRVLISYAQSLPDPDEPYRLATQGLPWLESFDARVTLLRTDGSPPQIVQRRFDGQSPPRDVVVPRTGAPASGLRHEQRVVARVEPLAGVDPGQHAPLRHLTVLFDTSASRALEHDESVDRLELLLRALARHAGTAQLSLYAFDQQLVPIYSGSLASMGRAPFVALHARRPLGASDLGAALEAIASGERDRVLLVTDGLVSAGPDSPAALRRSLMTLAQAGAQRLDVLSVGQIRDDARLRRLATGPLPRGGVLLDPDDPPDRLARRMALPTMDGLRLELPDAKWWHPRTLDGLQPGDHVIVHAELRGDASESLQVQVSGPVHTVQQLTLHEVDSPLLHHAWMYGRVEQLIERISALQDRFESEKLRQLAVSLSVRHRIFNDLTAMLVLETEEDYARFGLDRRALSDILVVRDFGVEVEHRAVPGEDPIEDPALGNEDPAPPEPIAGTGRIRGQVRDRDTGAPVDRAMVVLSCDCLPEDAETATNGRGVYVFDGLSAGTYSIRVFAGMSESTRVVPLPDRGQLVASFDVIPGDDSHLIEAEEDSRSRGRLRRRLRQRRETWRADERAAGGLGTRGDPTSPPAVKAPEPEPDVAAGPTFMPQKPAPVTTTIESSAIANRSAQEFVEVVSTVPGVSHDSAGISLAGTTGSETKYTVEGATVSNPAFGTIGMAGSYGGTFEIEPAQVLIRQFVVRGRGLARYEARQSTRAHSEQIERCYFRTLERDPGVRGRVRVELHLDADGRVTAVDALHRVGVRDATLLDCVDRALREVAYPVDGHAPKVRATLIFTSGSGPPDHDWEQGSDPPTRPTAPEPPSFTLEQVEQALASGRPRHASSLAWRWREADPASALALIALGRAAEVTGQTTLAARAYGSLLDLFPSRADMLRHAASRLAQLDEPALALAIDAYRRARAQRPDHPSSHRHLAYALLRRDRPKEAFAVLEGGLAQDYPPDRFNGAHRVLREDLGIVGSAWLRAHPIDARQIKARLSAHGAILDAEPSVRFVLTWETDANDVDLHVHDAEGHDAYHEQPTLPSGGELYADVDNGYGPECFAAYGEAAELPYRLMVHYFDRGPMGYGMGTVQLLHHDGQGRVTLEDRPFVITDDGAIADLGVASPNRSNTSPDTGNGPHTRANPVAHSTPAR